MSGWYPPATRSPGRDAGPFVAGYARKGIIHTTEGTSYLGAWATYRLLGVWPHFTCSYETGRFQVWQHLPITVAARALANPPGGVHTNRGGAIQIELVGTCNPRQRGHAGWLHVEDFPRGYLTGIAQLMRWISGACGIRPRTVTAWKPYPASYGLRNGLRLTAADWRAFNGWAGHCHVPEQTHGDPGSFPIHRLLPREGGDDMPDQRYFDDRFTRLEKVIKDQTGVAFNTDRADHRELLGKLTALPVPAEPEVVASAVVAALDAVGFPARLEEILAAVTADPPAG